MDGGMATIGVAYARGNSRRDKYIYSSDERFFSMFFTVKNVGQLCEIKINLHFTNESDGRGLESLPILIGTENKVLLTPMHEDDGKPLSEYMIYRRKKDHAIFDRLVKASSTGAADNQ